MTVSSTNNSLMIISNICNLYMLMYTEILYHSYYACHSIIEILNAFLSLLLLLLFLLFYFIFIIYLYHFSSLCLKINNNKQFWPCYIRCPIFSRCQFQIFSPFFVFFGLFFLGFFVHCMVYLANMISTLSTYDICTNIYYWQW